MNNEIYLTVDTYKGVDELTVYFGDDGIIEGYEIDGESVNLGPLRELNPSLDYRVDEAIGEYLLAMRDDGGAA
jgi:hypothetical protein